MTNRLCSVTVHIRVSDYPELDEFVGKPQAKLEFIAAACRSVARAMLGKSEVDLAAAIERIGLIAPREPESVEVAE